MSHETNQPIKRIHMGEWKPAGEGQTEAIIWLVLPSGQAFRYEAEVKRSGATIEMLSKPTRDELTQELDRKYGSPGES